MANEPKTPHEMDDEELLVAWDEATARAEETDDWSEVEALEEEVVRRELN